MTEATTMPTRVRMNPRRRIAQQRAILQPANGAALARGQRGGAALNRPGIPPADDLQTPAAQQRQHQTQGRAEAETELPGRARAERHGRDGRRPIIRIPDRPDREARPGRTARTRTPILSPASTSPTSQPATVPATSGREIMACGTLTRSRPTSVPQIRSRSTACSRELAHARAFKRNRSRGGQILRA